MRKCIIALCALGAGCASMSESGCRSTNWEQRGEQDGLRGQQASIYLYQHLCAPYGVQVPEKDYIDGWAWGYGVFNQRVQPHD
jgi:hypothetical protein